MHVTRNLNSMTQLSLYVLLITVLFTSNIW